MFKIWRKLSDIGVYPDTTESELKKIRLLNQMAILATIMQIAGILTLFANFTPSLLVASCFPLPFYLLVFYLQDKKQYYTARWVQIVSSIFIITIFNYLFGPGLNAVVAFFAIAPLIAIFLKEKRSYTILYSLIIICFTFSTVYNYYYSAPLEQYVLPIVRYYSFVIVFIALIIILQIFQSESDQREKELGNLLHKLKDKNEELERIAYVASHDLKTPLRHVSSYLSLIQLKLKNTDDPQLKEYLATAVKGSKRMYNTIEDVLEYSRVGDLDSSMEMVDLNQIIEKVSFNLQNEIQNKNAEINITSLPKIWANENQMVSLFQNLIENGLKYNKNEKAIIRIMAESDIDHHLISFSDNGIGMDTKYGNQIFEIFQRLHDQTQYEGSGVGLAICKRIVENHKGSIWLDKSDEKGSTFKIKLPILDEEKILFESSSNIHA